MFYQSTVSPGEVAIGRLNPFIGTKLSNQLSTDFKVVGASRTSRSRAHLTASIYEARHFPNAPGW